MSAPVRQPCSMMIRDSSVSDQTLNQPEHIHLSLTELSDVLMLMSQWEDGLKELLFGNTESGCLSDDHVGPSGGKD